MHSHHDVIVAGAGPVGLFLACELALAGCSVLVLEKAAQPDAPMKRLPFGMRGLSAPSIAALDRRGLFDLLATPRRVGNPFTAPGPQSRQPAGHFAGIQFMQDDIDTTQWPWRIEGHLPTAAMAEMHELERVLADRATALGVAIRRGAAVEAVAQDADGVMVRAGGQECRGVWLVGCDGSRSVVRKSLGIDFAGTEPTFTGYSVQVDLVDSDGLAAGRNLTPTGMYVQMQPGVFAIQDVDGGAFHDSGLALTLQHVQEVLRHVSGTAARVTALHAGSTWTDRARQAVRYRAGRVLLAGDAAHIHSPLGGQGLNLGLGDAMNLGWKLGSTIQGTAPDGLLDTYHAERHPVGAAVLDWSRAQVALMDPSPAARALHAIMRDLVGTRDGATYMAGRVRGVSLRYELGCDHPLVGRSVPDFAFRDGATVGAALRDGRALLLDFRGDAVLAARAGGWHGRVRYLSGAADDTLGLSAVLVRPDGFVAWAADGDPDHAALRDAIVRWCGQVDG